jgi:HEAT repeat protein
MSATIPRIRTVDLLAILLMAAAAILLLLMAGLRQPSYAGKTLNEWISQSQTAEELSGALAAMDSTKAARFLTRQLRWKPDRILVEVRRWWPGFQGPTWLQKRTQDPRLASAYALGLLGSQARSAVPELETVLRTLDETPANIHIRESVIFALVRIRDEPLAPYIETLGDTLARDWFQNIAIIKMCGTNASAAVPALLHALETTNQPNNWLFKAHACEALGSIHSQPDRCVPALVPLLESPQLEVRQAALRALKQFGTAAQAARTAVAGCLNDPDPWTRTNAVHLLEELDSATLSKPR